MRLIGFLVRSSAWLLASAVFTSIVGGVLGPVLISLINDALSAPAAELPRIGLAFTGLSVAMLVLRWVSKTQFVQLSQGTLARLRSFICAGLAHAPYRDLERTGSARLLTVLTEDVATLSLFFVMLPRMVMQGAVVFGCLGYLALLSPRAFVFALGTVLIGSLGRYFGSRQATRHLRLALAEEERLFAHFQALFSGAKELRLNAARREAFVAGVLDESARAVERRRVRGEGLQVASMNTGVFLFYVMIGLLVFVIGRGMAESVRSGYALTLLYMMLPVHALLESIPAIGRARTALERTAAVGVGVGASGELSPRAPSGLPSPALLAAPVPEAAPAADLWSIRLEGATHRYRRETEDGDFLLGPLQLELCPGEVVFLVGGNGSGKTTLAKLLVGLYEPDSGEAHWNGVAVVAETREAYRQNFSAIFSDYHLFDSLLGLEPRQIDERARTLLQALHLEHKVEIRDGVLSTTQLSSGQRKRLALLVAVLEDRPVYVFDEWAADQDPEYKEIFYQQVLPDLKTRGKAVFVISHDDRYFHLADRLLRLEAGKLLPPDRGLEQKARPPRGEGPRAIEPFAALRTLEDGAS